jgi:D-alanyl-D-alanine carboxypeptidase
VLALSLAVLIIRPAFAGYSSIVVDDATGDVIHEMNADVANYPASLTKIMTLYLTFEALNEKRISLDQAVPVSEHASIQAPSKLGLEPGDTVLLQDAILGVVTKSANDAAVVLAEAVGGSESAFAQMMTVKARDLGMTATEFRNASGLPDPDQVTTARDMALMARAVMRDFPQYYHFFRTPQFTFDGHVFENHNRLLKTYAGADGLKTGYIRASGFNLVASAERGGRRLVGVVMGSQSPSARNAQMARLLDASFLGQTTRLAAIEGKPDGASASSAPPVVASATPGASRAAAKAAGPDRSWGIQVGAFSRFAPAHLAASRAARNAPRLLSRSKVAIDTASDEGNTIYRARIMGLTELRARKACAVLASKKMECLTVAGDGTVASVSTEQGDTDQSGR